MFVCMCVCVRVCVYACACVYVCMCVYQIQYSATRSFIPHPVEILLTRKILCERPLQFLRSRSNGAEWRHPVSCQSSVCGLLVSKSGRRSFKCSDVNLGHCQVKYADVCVSACLCKCLRECLFIFYNWIYVLGKAMIKIRKERKGNNERNIDNGEEETEEGRRRNREMKKNIWIESERN